MRYLSWLVIMVVGCNASPHFEEKNDYYPALVNEIIRREGFDSKSGHGDHYRKCRNNRVTALKNLEKSIDSLYRLMPGHLSHNQKLAVSSLAYNIGFKRLKSFLLWKQIVENRVNIEDWYNISVYKGKRNDNLRQSRLFEIQLFCS